MENRDNARTQCNGIILSMLDSLLVMVSCKPNYTEINVKQQLNDKFSILSYYKALIQLKI